MNGYQKGIMSVSSGCVMSVLPVVSYYLQVAVGEIGG